MKIHSIEQNLKCSQCRSLYVLRTCKRMMNFTFGEITFYCQRCHAKIGFLTFTRWNALYRAYFENPRPAPPPRDEQGHSRQGRRRRRRDRGPRQGRGEFRGPRQSSPRS